MLDKIKEWSQKAFTEKDNQTYCPVRFAYILVGLVYHIGLFYMVIGQKTTIDMNISGQYITQMGQLILAGAASIGVKSVLKADA